MLFRNYDVLDLQGKWISLILILLGDCAAIAKQRGAL